MRLYGSFNKNPSRFEGKDHPVDSVSWTDCQKILKQINRARPGLNLELPTEAQWEYACRARQEVGSGQYARYAFGNELDPSMANYGGGKKGTVPVKSFSPNDRGLYDMHGNVWEWCRDWYGEYESGDVVDPTGTVDGADRVLRGGSWIFTAEFCRSAVRNRYDPGSRFHFIGFRFSRGQAGGRGAGSGGGVPDMAG